ncbi:MAG: glycosyltransferase, partial [Acidimicrobiia bacterium]|nr:glycosyltransferase [Acidimicrobiia bacterium]
QNHWGTERVAHQLLRERQPDFPLSLFGQDRGIDHSLSRHVRGPISFFALPSLYNQAAIVVDDLLAQNAPFGNTNSRLFEALACGAVTLTNQTLGRDALGLQAVPAYRNASELFDLIHAELDGADLRSTVKALHATILERHTYEYRAAEFIAHLDDTASQTRARRSAPTVIGFFPDYRDNPYQEMMWAQLRDEGAIPVGVDDGFDAVPLVKALSDHRLFHLSWTAPILGPARTEADRLARYRRFLSLLDTLDTARIPSIWTVHNVLPHECADPSMERSLRQEIADRVDLIHVMCERTASEVSADYQLPAGKVRVVPHPSYIDVYPNLIDQDTARYELGLHPDEMTYLFFGQVRDYKGVDLLLDSFERLHRHRPRSRLIIAGQPGRFPGRPEIEQRARAHPAIISHLHSIGDADVQLYMNAADVVVLPYRQVLNSGAMMLAFSFARPVITAAAGCIPETFDDTTGITFSWDDGEAALYRTMLEGERLRDEGYRHAAYRAAGRHHYREASRAFAELAEEAWAQRGIATT